MPLRHVELDPADYVIIPHVAILDEFRMTAADGSFVADITPEFIDKLIAHMSEREALTGDLCPLVIGHTQDGEREVDAPPLVGYARNWHRGFLGDTGRVCAFFDAWVLKSEVERVKRYPRRSGEVWASRYEIDPISLLGATTPARDLGLLRLARDGSFTYYSPGDMNMGMEDKPKADPKESGKAKGDEGKWEQVLEMLTQIKEALMGGKSDPAAPAGAAPEGAAGGGGEMSDEEYQQLLQELGQGGGAEPDTESRAGEKPAKNSGGYCDPKETESSAKMSRLEQELADNRAEVARMKVKDSLTKLQRQGKPVDPEDAALVEDLVAMEPTLRDRQIARLGTLPAAPSADSVHLSRALDNAIVAGGRRKMTREDAQKLSRKASIEKKTFEQVASEAGFDLS